MVSNDLVCNWGQQQGLQPACKPSICIIPRLIPFVALNGFPKLDMDIIMRPMKLYKSSSKAMMSPLVVESSKGEEVKMQIGP